MENSFNQKRELNEAKKGFLFGILSIPGAFFCIIPGIVLGILGFVKSRDAISIYEKNRESYNENDLKKANNGKILSIIGGSLSVLFIILTILVPNDKNTGNSNNIDNTQKKELSIEEQVISDSLEKAKKDSLELVEKIRTDSLELVEKYKTKKQIEKELAAIKKGIDFSEYDKTVESLQIELILFGAWSKIIAEGKAHEDKGTQKLAEKLKKKVIQMQIKEFPRLRKKYAKVVSSKLWESNIEVHSNGSGHRIINFTGGLFANNKNKKDFQEQVHEILTMFRFSQARYRWYKGEDEYTYWKITSKKDNDLVTF